MTRVKECVRLFRVNIVGAFSNCLTEADSLNNIQCMLYGKLTLVLHYVCEFVSTTWIK